MRKVVGTLTSLVMMIVCTATFCGMAGVAKAQAGGILYPEKNVEKNIAHLEATVKSLISRFGSEIDQQTLQILARAVQAIDSLKIAYHGSLNQIFEKMSSERQDTFYAIGNVLEEIDDTISNNLEDVSDIEKRLSDTLVKMSRASQTPWLLSYSPVSFLENRPADLVVRIEGKNLQRTESKLIVAGREFAVRSAQASSAEFIVPKDALAPGPDGFVHAKLLLASPEDPFWFWNSRDVVEFNLILRPLSARIGTYTLWTRVVDSTSIGQTISDDSATFSTEVEEKGKIKTERHCLRIQDLKRDGVWVFEPARTEIVVEHNARIGRKSLCNAPNASEAVKQAIDCSRSKYQNPPPKLMLSTPDKLCMQIKVSSRSKAHNFGSAKVVARFRYVIHQTGAASREFTDEGAVFWNADKPIRLPDGHQGFQIEFLFDDLGERRVFFRPGRYGPIQVKYDENTKTVSIGGIIK